MHTEIDQNFINFAREAFIQKKLGRLPEKEAPREKTAAEKLYEIPEDLKVRNQIQELEEDPGGWNAGLQG